VGALVNEGHEHGLGRSQLSWFSTHTGRSISLVEAITADLARIDALLAPATAERG
jgi:hypothetical protein